jgi:hypothetical protein
MAEVTYYVALPFVARDDGVAAGEPTECFNPMAVVMRAEALSRKEGHVGAVAFIQLFRGGDASDLLGSVCAFVHGGGQALLRDPRVILVHRSTGFSKTASASTRSTW